MDNTNMNHSERLSFYRNPIGYEIKAYITEDIKEPSYYDDLVQEIGSVSKSDVVTLVFNSNGGYLETSAQLYDVIRACEATTLAVIQGNCHSGASMLALACDEIIVHPSANMLIHTSTGGTIGKNSDVRKEIEFEAKRIDNLLERCYSRILTSEEIEDLKKGIDVWLDADDILSRLTKEEPQLELTI